MNKPIKFVEQVNGNDKIPVDNKLFDQNTFISANIILTIPNIIVNAYKL